MFGGTPRTGSGKLIGNVVCASGTGEPIRCISTCWSGNTQCDDYEQFDMVVRTTDSGVCFSEPGELASKLNRPWLSLYLIVSIRSQLGGAGLCCISQKRLGAGEGSFDCWFPTGMYPG